jgi:hypothetical protein
VAAVAFEQTVTFQLDDPRFMNLDSRIAVDLLDDRASLPRSRLLSRTPKISLMRWAVKRQSPISQAALEDLVDGKVTLEDEVAAVLDLCDGVKPRKVHLATFPFWRTSVPTDCASEPRSRA